MANIKTTYARFFPKKKNQLPKELVNWIMTDITEDLKHWAITWYIPIDESYLDLVFTSKSILDYDIFKNQKVLETFHIWIRISDEGGAKDFIGFKSNTFKTSKKYYRQVGYSGKDESWNYFNSCIYSADKLSIHLSSKDEESIDKFIKPSKFWNISKELNDENVWEMNFHINYFRCSYSILNHDKYYGKQQNINFFDNIFGEGEVTEILYDDYRFQLNEYFFSKRYKWNKDLGYSRIDENLLELNFWENNKKVHKFKWASSKEGWIESCYTGWDNVSDKEYIRFKSIYEERRQ